VSDDLVWQLRDISRGTVGGLHAQAADEIERLRAELARRDNQQDDQPSPANEIAKRNKQISSLERPVQEFIDRAVFAEAERDRYRAALESLAENAGGTVAIIARAALHPEEK